jgi:hypothetical protein
MRRTSASFVATLVLSATSFAAEPVGGDPQWPFPPAPPAPLTPEQIERSARQAPGAPLPPAVVKALCEKYEGKRAFVANGTLQKLNCVFITERAVVPKTSLIPEYRAILATARTLRGLRTATLPTDLACGTFEERATGDTRTITCSTDLGDGMRFDFVARQDGTLTGVRVEFDYKSMYREGMEQSKKRGKISEFYEPWIELYTDLQIATLNLTRDANDTVEVDGDRITVFVAAR